jgi:3-mercaptopyruvate sulfurtransferase SseA
MIKHYAKAFVALFFTALGVVNVAALPERWQAWIATALAIAATLGVRQATNEPPAAPQADSHQP